MSSKIVLCFHMLITDWKEQIPMFCAVRGPIGILDSVQRSAERWGG